MRLRDAERAAKRFIHTYYEHRAHWLFDIVLESDGRSRGLSWSFGLTPDESDPEYEPGAYMVGYVHADGVVEGLY
jgi:hypothetical protein